MEQNQVATTQQITETDLVSHLTNMGLMKDLTDGEKNTYLQIAKAFNLNPFKREIYVSKYNGQMSIIVGYETYIKRAERSGMLDGWEVTTSGINTNGSWLMTQNSPNNPVAVPNTKYTGMNYARFTLSGNASNRQCKVEMFDKKGNILYDHSWSATDLGYWVANYRYADNYKICIICINFKPFLIND